jgi:hypothetical protein
MIDKMDTCPFCGSDKVTYYSGWAGGGRTGKNVNDIKLKQAAREKNEEARGREPCICCGGCGIGFSRGWFSRGISDKQAKKKTVTAWNRRPGRAEP